MEESTFGGLLRAARQESLLTLEGLAAISGVSARAISDMERGRSMPRQATLAEVLDALQPDENTRRRLVAASARHGTGVPRQLPPDLAVFRGREDALKAVRAVTSQVADHGPCVAIAAVGGMAGVGKTTLAVHWAHEVADLFPDGQLYVNLRGFDEAASPLTPGEALGGFLSALGVPRDGIPADAEGRSALFREWAASRRMIVLLDNARDGEQVRPLLPASAGCLTLVTSRNQLSGLAAVDGASLINLDVWAQTEAVTALAARVGQQRCAAEPEAAAELVRLCGYLPLAVAVIGAQIGAVPELSLRAAAEELRGARLDALAVHDRRADVRAVFSWSYGALAPQTARFFRHLALHPGSAVSAEAAASLSGVELAQARRHLRELVSASLLSRDAEGRYVLHDLIRAYGAELAGQEHDDRMAAWTRFLDYLRHNAHAASGALETRLTSTLGEDPAPGVVLTAIDTHAEALDWFRREEPAVMGAVVGLDEAALLPLRTRLTADWEGYFSIMGLWAEEISVQRICLAAAVTLDDPVAIARNSGMLARALTETGRAHDADEPVESALRQFPRLSVAERASAERCVAWVRGRQGRLADALRHARGALALYRTLDQPSHVARELNAVGWYLALLGEYPEAIAMCQEALPILQQKGNHRNEAATWDSIGYARQHLGDLDTAIADYRCALALYEQVLDTYGQVEVLDHLASAHLAKGEAGQATALWNRAAGLLGPTGGARADEMRSKAATAQP
ncbi:ATP-binding protein [Streptomyces sp. NPDC060184]|uniref:ATP-binding protein n=1 Tax=Streptomyces sp. NPDC060184 TaxID=3347064 RepID=UPI00365B7CC0